MNEPSKDIGSILKQERERQGISLETVHAATKIPIDSLKAIEEGYKVRTLTAFYYKSFVRIYAQHLGLNPESLLAQISSDTAQKRPDPVQRAAASGTPSPKDVFKPLSIQLPPRPVIYRGTKKVFKIFVGMLSVAIVLVLISGLVRKMRPSAPVPGTPAVKEEKRDMVKEKSVPAAVSEAVKKPEEKKVLETARPSEPLKPGEGGRPVEPAKPVQIVKKNEPAPKKPESAKPEEVKPVVVAKKPAEVKEVAADSSKKAVAAAKPSKVSVSVRAVNNAWLNVRADGSPVFQGILKKGTSDSWTAAKVISISGKDINQLEFEVNGKPIGRLSRRGAPAKKIRITPEGLTVEK